MQVKDAMVPRDRLITADTSTTILEAMEILVTNRIGALVIIGEEQVVGLVTSRDLMNTVVVKGCHGCDITIKEVMATKLLTINEKESLNRAVEKMDQYMTHHILAKDSEGHITGILSSFDIVREATLNSLLI